MYQCIKYEVRETAGDASTTIVRNKKI